MRLHDQSRQQRCTWPGCTKTFASRQPLLRHYLIHTNERPHQCPDCPASFRCSSHLKRHARQHSGLRPYSCPECDKSYTDRTGLTRHMVSVHQALPYRCGWPSCDAAFKSWSGSW
eukprot:m.130353 g.130353  ORF g.130353 m.130353 type:complete len:115 (+) comp14773_c7_seq1:890-1234(+)